MTKDEALDLALEALRSAAAELYIASSYCNTYEVLDNTNDAITAIKQAVALDKMADNARELGLDYEPHKGLSEHVAQATNGRVRIDPASGDVGIGTPPAQPEPMQKPVAWPCVIAEADFEKNTITLEMQCSDYKVGTGQHWLHTAQPLAQPAPVQKRTNYAVHLHHCNIGECEGVCKYGDDNCPALEHADIKAKWDRSTPPAAQPAPVQEPVWIQPNHLQKAQKAPFLCRVEPHKRDDFVALYTTPPAAQRQWVGLTDEEILAALCIHVDESDDPDEWWSEIKEVRAIEAKLRSKNGY